MATNPAVPYWDEATTLTAHAATAVTGKRFATIAGARTEGNPTIGHAATGAPAGVTAHDAAADTKVTVYVGKQAMPVTAAVAITAGEALYSTADGSATNVAAGPIRGYAYDDAAAGTDVPVKLV